MTDLMLCNNSFFIHFVPFKDLERKSNKKKKWRKSLEDYDNDMNKLIGVFIIPQQEINGEKKRHKFVTMK